MTRIIDRYLLREVVRTFIGVTVVLFLILLGDQFARGLARAAADAIPRDAVLKLMGLTSLEYLSLMVPAAFFFAVMLALGRLYRDSEMAALQACGVGARRILKPLLWAAALVAAGLAILSFDTIPWAARMADEIKEEGKRNVQLAALEPGRFRSALDGRLVFFARSRNDSGQLTGIFIQRREGADVEVVTASRAEQRIALEDDENFLVLYDGVRYVGRPGTPEFQTARFQTHGIPLPVPGRNSPSDERRQQPTLDLLGSGAAEDIAEVHWRFAAPASVLLLTLLAVPLAKSGPRAGRYARLGFGILIYIIYSNLLGVGRTFVEDGRVAGWLGLWWVHGIVLAAAALLLFYQVNGFRRLLPRRGRA